MKFLFLAITFLFLGYTLPVLPLAFQLLTAFFAVLFAGLILLIPLGDPLHPMEFDTELI